MVRRWRIRRRGRRMRRMRRMRRRRKRNRRIIKGRAKTMTKTRTAAAARRGGSI